MSLLRRLHAWVGLVLCLVLAAIAFSGAALAFKDDIRRAMIPVRSAPPQAQRLAGVMRAAETLAGPGQLRTVIFASPTTPWHEATLKNGEVIAMDDGGRVIKRWPENGRLFDALYDLHHHLLMGEAGIPVTGWVGVLAFLMAISGLVLWWPAWRSFRAVPVPTRNNRAGWLAAHRDLAVMTAPLVLLSILTGTPMALQDISRPLMDAPPAKAPKARTEGPVDWTAQLTSAQARFPAAALRMGIEPTKTGAPVSIRLRQPMEWHVNGRTNAYLEPATAVVISVHDDQAQSTGGKLYNVLWPIHAAKVGGVLWKAVILLSGLSLGLMALYGGESYRRRLMSPRKRT